MAVAVIFLDSVTILVYPAKLRVFRNKNWVSVNWASGIAHCWV